MGLQHLCDELLVIIFTHFFFHCQNLGYFPNADVLDVRINKRTLAYLCRTARALRVVAQPILYHYYATGNLQIETKLYQDQDEDGRTSPHWEPDYFPHFLRIVIPYPYLASQAKTAQLILNYESPVHSSQLDRAKLVIKNAATRSLVPWSTTRTQDSIHYTDLIALALMCLPCLHTLLISVSDPAVFSSALEGFEWDEPPKIPFPALKTLGLIAQRDRDHHFTQPRALYRAAINLETVYACDAGGWAMHNSFTNHVKEDYDAEYFSLANMRKLVIEGLTPRNVQGVLERTEKLENLEFCWDRYRLITFDLDEILEPRKPTLKPLCLAYLPYVFYDATAPYDLPSVDYPPITSLSDFILEGVSLDCRSIYRETDPDAPYRLSKLLPGTIRRLRISFLYRGIANGLSDLAARASREFVRLKEVLIGVAACINDKHSMDIEKRGRLATYSRPVGFVSSGRLTSPGQTPGQ